MFNELAAGLGEMKEMNMNKEIVIDCKNDGTVSGMHFDEFDLGFLGKKTVRRASEIIHNPETDLWDILLPTQITPPSSGRRFSLMELAPFTAV